MYRTYHPQPPADYYSSPAVSPPSPSSSSQSPWSSHCRILLLLLWSARIVSHLFLPLHIQHHAPLLIVAHRAQPQPRTRHTFSTKNPVPTSTSTLSVSFNRPGTYRLVVSGTSILAPSPLPSFDPACCADNPRSRLRIQSANFDCAARSWLKELFRCCSSSSSCFFTCRSCWGVRVVRSTVGLC